MAIAIQRVSIKTVLFSAKTQEYYNERNPFLIEYSVNYVILHAMFASQIQVSF
jgi:hypothetical protein